MLEIRRGDGTFVSNLEPETLLGGLGFMLDLMQDGTMLEIFEVRRLFEPPATGLADLRATAQDIEDLKESLHRLNQGEQRRGTHPPRRGIPSPHHADDRERDPLHADGCAR